MDRQTEIDQQAKQKGGGVDRQTEIDQQVKGDGGGQTDRDRPASQRGWWWIDRQR